MRNVNSHLLEDKVDEAVTHYLNSHQPGDVVHVDGNTLSLNIHDESGRVVTVMHGQGFSSHHHLSRQMSVGEQVSEGPWCEELLDPESRLAALVAHLARSHHPPHHKISSVRSDLDASVILDTPMRLFNGQTLEAQDAIAVHAPALTALPPLQEMKRCQDTDWFNDKHKNTLKEEAALVSESEGAAPGRAASRKSLPHKKRLSRKLRRAAPPAPAAPAPPAAPAAHQDIVVINCTEDVQHEEILPDNFVTSVQHPEHLPEDTHHITHEVRAMFICQLCGSFYGDEQLKFYQHLKQHYEPHATIIIDNPVSDLNIDKMTNTCIVDNVATLPDSIVELSLESTVPKTMYQPIDKHLYTTSDKTLYSNKVQYSMASMDKEPAAPATEADKADLYCTLDKLEPYTCMKCDKSFRRQKQCEAHIKEAHSNSKLEDMGEFSEPEDLMEGIHVAVEEAGEQYEQALLPHLTVDNGHVHQDHVRHWYMRTGAGADGALVACGAADAYCPVCPAPRDPPHHPHHDPHDHHDPQDHHDPHDHHDAHAHQEHHEPHHLKEEVLQRIFESEVATEQPFTDVIIENDLPPAPHGENKPSDGDDKKKVKKFECPQCGRVFHHRNSLLYHVLSHSGKQQVCRDCGKGFYTVGALKIHKRVHNGDKPYKCEDCGRDFRQWSDLKYHSVSLHSNQKHFKCEFCGKEFARKYSLNVHRRIHTGEKNYKCEYCSKTFRASSYRLSHMRTHTGDKPYKCDTCDKCFRVAGDLRRHALTHERARARRPPPPHPPPSDPPHSPLRKKIAAPSPTKSPGAKLDKKQKATKRNTIKRVGAPNVTVDRSAGFKLNTEHPADVDVFDTRQEFTKFKEVYADAVEYKAKECAEQMVYKESERSTGERDFATLRPVRAENTDGKMHVFTHVEKKEFDGPAVGGSVTLGDIRNIERERGDSMHGENIENGFLERLTALYNIPAV